MQLQIHVLAGDDVDDGDELDQRTRALMRELGELGEFDDISQVTVESPAGAKSGLGTLLGEVSLELASGSLVPLVTMLANWVRRQQRRCTLEVDLGGATVRLDDRSFEEIDDLVRQLQTSMGRGGPEAESGGSGAA